MRENFFGKEKAEKYGKQILDVLSGRKISKRKSLAEKPGGLVYEAKLLGISEWDLLEALEGMCCFGTAREIDDSTYLVITKGGGYENCL